MEYGSIKLLRCIIHLFINFFITTFLEIKN